METDGIRWRFLNTGFGSAFFNMAVDEALATGVADGTSPPTLRVFGWRPPAVSLGYAQKAAHEVDLARCREMGVDVVRRPSGGRAVLHWDELTYSVTCRYDHPVLGGGVSESYRKISACLVAGLRGLGLDARFEPGRLPAAPARGKGPAPPCFSTTVQYEVTLQGRKLVGSAQRRAGQVLLQHGSLLMGPGHKRISDLAAPATPQAAARFRDALDRHTVSLQEATGTIWAFDEVAEGLRRGFCSAAGLRLDDGPLSASERSCAERLVAAKYGTEAWNLGQGAAPPPRGQEAVPRAGPR